MVLNKFYLISKTALNGFVDIFYPRICSGCQRVLNVNEKSLCFYCIHNLPKTFFHTRKTTNDIEKIFWGRLAIDKATSFVYFSKGGIAQNIIHSVKYHKQWETGILTGKLFGYDLMNSDFLDEIDFIVPVPLHPKKEKIRGYNQSTCFGVGLREATGIPVNDTNLYRKQHSVSQTLKGRFSRWENVNTLFEIKDEVLFEDKHILLLDDVITTGSTLEATGKALQKAKNVRISIATIGFASQLP